MCLRKTSSHIRSVTTAGELTDQLTSEDYGKARGCGGKLSFINTTALAKITKYSDGSSVISVTCEKRHARAPEGNLSDSSCLDQEYFGN